jgi:hypothetical protein
VQQCSHHWKALLKLYYDASISGVVICTRSHHVDERHCEVSARNRKAGVEVSISPKMAARQSVLVAAV